MKIFVNTGVLVAWRRLDRLAAAAGTVAILLTCGCMGGGEVAPPGNSAGNGTGHFTLPAVPPYSYVIVSRGGTDTLSGKPAMMMLAPSGAQNVSALTTM